MGNVNLLFLPIEEGPARHAFVWDHLQAHRDLLAQRKTSGPLTLLLDPMQNEDLPASKWHVDHQEAHNNVRAGINSDQILRDSNLSDEEQRLWWTFINHQEHMLLTAAKPSS
jgi:hypothetical protein